MATFNYMKQKIQTQSVMRFVLRYVIQESKTTCDLISGIDCSPQNAYRDFMTTKNAYNKAGGIFFYHYTQSFSPQEDVTPEQAHQIGRELAEKQFKGFEAVVATHIDRDHIHTHLVINSVSHENGKKLRQHPTSLREHRAVSDVICEAYGLSILEPYTGGQKKKGLGAREYRAAERGNSWKFALMGTIDNCMDRSFIKEDFILNMRKRGYDVDFNDGDKKRKTITYTTPTGYKCRDNRLHEEKYLKENMLHEFRLREIQIRINENNSAQFTDGIPFDEAVSAADIRDTSGALGGNRKDSDIDGNPVQIAEYATKTPVDGEIVPDLHQRIAAGAEQSNADAIGTNGSTIEQDIVSGGENGRAVGADVTTGWEASRERLFTMQGNDGFVEPQTDMAEPESVRSHGAYGSLAADILRLAKNVSKISDNADDLENIIALSALVGLSVMGVYKLIETLQSRSASEASDAIVEEIIKDLSQDYGLEQGATPVFEQQIEHEQEYTLIL